jgi:plastocyanin
MCKSIFDVETQTKVRTAPLKTWRNFEERTRMAQKSKQSAPYIVCENGELIPATKETMGAIRVAPLYLDGTKVEGVYSEVEHGDLDRLMGADLTVEKHVEVAPGLEQRDTLLKRWIDTAREAKKAKRAGAASMMLLTLAACGGGGGGGVEVKRAEINEDGQRVDISGARAGAIITVANETDDDTYDGVTLNAEGEGILLLDFADEDDVVVLDASSDIEGFSIIEVVEGTVDFTAVTLPGSVSVLNVGSGAIITFDQFDALDEVGLRDGADDGEIKVIVTSLDEARSVDSSTSVEDGVDVLIEIANGDAGVLTIDEYNELVGLVINEELTYSIEDAGANLFDFDGDVAIGIKDDVADILEGATSVVITDDRLSLSAELLEDLQGFGVQFEGQVFSLDRSSADADEGDAVTFTLQTVNVAEGSRFDYDIRVDGGSAAGDIDGSVSGTAFIDGTGKAVISVNLSEDRLTEGSEVLTIEIAGETQSIEINDTSLDPTYALSASAGNVDEGNAVVFTLETERVDPGQTFDWEITGVSAADVVGPLSGTATVGADGTAEVSIELVEDRLTEGAESLTLNFDGIAVSETVTVNDTSLDPTYALSASAGNVDEGNAVVFTLETERVDPGQTFAYTITGISPADVVGGESALSGVATIGADGRALVEVELVADQTTEAPESLTLSFSGIGVTETVDINDTSVNPEQRFTTEEDDIQGNTFDNFYVGRVSNEFFSSGTPTTYQEGDAADGDGGNNTLRLFMDPGAVGDGVDVSNIQNLDLRLNAGEGSDGDTTQLFMTDWDQSLDDISIRSNKSNLEIREQQTIAPVSITDVSTDDTQSSSYSFDYAAGVADGNSDALDLTLNNVNGEDGADVTVDAGIETVRFDIQDREGEQYESDINLTAPGAANLEVSGGRDDQSFTLEADVESGADFNSTEFAGDMVLESTDIRTAQFGDGDDRAVDGEDGQADSITFNFDMGEGDNTFVANGNLAGDVSAGDGQDDVTVDGDLRSTGSISTGDGPDRVDVGEDTFFGSSINVGDGSNDVNVAGYHAGSIVGGEDNDDVTVGEDTGDLSSISLGDGSNSVEVEGLHRGSITGGADYDKVQVGSTVAGSNIDTQDGQGDVFVEGDHAGSIAGGEDYDYIEVSRTLAGSYVNAGDGDNEFIVNDTHNGSYDGGAGEDSVQIENGVAGGSIYVAGGDFNSVDVGGDMLDGTITVGDGNNNTVTIDGSVIAGSPGTITFGDGNNNFLSIGEDLDGDAVVFGNGSDNRFEVGEDVFNEASITLGDGGNSGDVAGSVSGGSTITFGSGEDALTVGDNFVDDGPLVYSSGYSPVPAIQGEDLIEDEATTISMGGGNDQFTMDAGVEPLDVSGYGPGEDALIQSGGFVDGGEGDDDIFTVNTVQNNDTTVIERTLDQKAEINLFSADVNSYLPGDVITVSFADGAGVIADVTYTVTAGDIVQGDGAATSENVVAGLITALEASSANDVFNFTAINGSSVNGYDTSVYVQSEDPHQDYTITATRSSNGEDSDIPVTNTQISDARVTNFEHVELVVGDDDNTPDTAGQNNGFNNGQGETIVNADFDLINGVETILLDSQASVDSTVEVFTNVTHETLPNGAYAKGFSNDAQIFDLDNVAGGEAITVRGNETSTEGNVQVDRINVDPQEDAHQIGDKITVTIGETEMVYTVTENDLADGQDETIDADLIAAGIAEMINALSGQHGFTAVFDTYDAVDGTTDGSGSDGYSEDNFGVYGEDDYDIGAWVTLTGEPNLSAAVLLTHERHETQEFVRDNDVTSWDVTGELNDPPAVEAGDVITVYLNDGGADGEVAATYTVTEEDCLRLNADQISASLAEQFGGDAEANWGAVSFGDTSVNVVVTRIVDALENDPSETAVGNLQEMTATDDGDEDVIIDAVLADGAGNTTMDLTVDGYGDFDIAIVGEESGYTDLELTLADENSHTIDTGGQIDGGDGGNFSETITVVDSAETSSEGESIVLENVLAHSVDTTGAAGDFTIDQLAVRNAAGDFSGEIIDVQTAGGDDHLITLGQSAINGDSVIDLDGGSNELSLGWGEDTPIHSADLEQVGGIDYSGDLTQLNILTDVVLDDDGNAPDGINDAPAHVEDGVTILSMPGGVDDVEKVTFTDLNSVSDDVADLTINGAANVFEIESVNDFNLGGDSFLEVGTLTVNDASGEEITGSLGVVTGEDAVFNLGNNDLDAVSADAGDTALVTILGKTSEDIVTVDEVSVSAGEQAVFGIVGNEGAEIGLGPVDIMGDSATVYVVENNGMQAALGAVTLDASGDAGFIAASNSDDTVLDIESIDVDAGDEAFVALGLVSFGGEDEGNTDSTITVSGSTSLYADVSDAILEIGDNLHTDVIVSEEEGIDITSCSGDAVMGIIQNSNEHDPFGPDPDSENFIQDYSIITGDVALNGGEDTLLQISDNSDDTYFGNLTVDVGDVSMLAYGDAGLVIDDNLATDINIGAEEISTPLSLEGDPLAVDIRAQDNGSVILSNNDGQVYENTLSNPPRDEPDYADIDIGNIHVDADINAFMGVGGQNIAQVDTGNVTLMGGEDAGLEIVYNGADDDGVMTVPTNGSPQEDLPSVIIDLGNVDIMADGLAGVSIGQDYSGEFDVSDGGTSDGGNVHTDVTIGDVDITSTGDGEDSEANILIANNQGSDIDVKSVTTSSERSTNFFIYGNTATWSSIVAGVTIGDVTMAGVENANFDVFDNEGWFSQGERVVIEVGNIDLTADRESGEDADFNAQFSFVDNLRVDATFGDVDLSGVNTTFKINANGDEGTASNEDITVGDVTLTSVGDEGVTGLADVSVDDNVGATIEIGDVDINSAESDQTALISVSQNARSSVTAGDVVVDAGENGVEFQIVENFDSTVTIGAGSDEAIDIDAGFVGSYDGEDAEFGFDVFDNTGTSTITLGDITVDASGLNISSDVAMRFDADDAESSGTDIEVGDITINADGDAYFDGNGVDTGDGGETLEMGDIVISTGLDEGEDDVSSDLFFHAVDFEGNELHDGEDSQSITLNAGSAGTGEGDVFALIGDASNLSELSVSGSNAEIYLEDDMGDETDGTEIFTLDLTGLEGSFDTGAADFDPLGLVGSNLGQENGVYVETYAADFGGDIVDVQIGSSDLIYNAQHSSMASAGEGSNDWGAPWDADEDGWYSLGSGGEFAPEAMVQTVNFDGANDWSDGDTLSFDYEGVTYEFEVDTGATGFSETSGNSFDATGLILEIDGTDSFTLTGTPDGQPFMEVSNFDANFSGTGQVTSGTSDIDPNGTPAEDNFGQSDAKEIFTFTGDSVGEIVIGGFNPGEWGSVNPDNGRVTDRLDFSGFDWNGNGLDDDDGLVDLNAFSITVEDDDGFFEDVVIDFIGNGNIAAEDVDFGEIRLVGVGEFEDADTLVADSMVL